MIKWIYELAPLELYSLQIYKIWSKKHNGIPLKVFPDTF